MRALLHFTLLGDHYRGSGRHVYAATTRSPSGRPG